MSKFNISEASRITKKARSTIQRHINQGLLSAEKNAQGKKVIDVSELQRVYGNLDIDATAGVVTQSAAPIQPAPPQSDLEMEFLKRDFKHLQEKYDSERERRQQAEEEIAKLLGIVETQTRQLAAPRDEQTEQIKQKGFWAWLLGR